MLFAYLAPFADQEDLKQMSSRLNQHLQLPAEEKEAGIESVFRELAAFTARSLVEKYAPGSD
jgi:hypothetical protein